MESTHARRRVLEDVPVPLRLKLSALWAATMFLVVLIVWYAWRWPAQAPAATQT